MKIIKFDLPINGIKVKNLDELGENLTDELVTHARSGLLTRWMTNRGLVEEAEKVTSAANTVRSDVDLFMEICNVIKADVFKEDVEALFSVPVQSGGKLLPARNRQVDDIYKVIHKKMSDLANIPDILDWPEKSRDIFIKKFMGEELQLILGQFTALSNIVLDISNIDGLTDKWRWEKLQSASSAVLEISKKKRFNMFGMEY